MSNSRKADFDIPGAYNQNAINGFDDRLIQRMFEHADLGNAHTVMDAMAGDGNLSVSMYEYCQRENIDQPDTVLYELSEVQNSRAKEHLKDFPVKVVNGNILELNHHPEISPSSFDRVLLKSANHEIPLKNQAPMYENILGSLKPGASFINLGMLFEDEGERDESREMARVKDQLAGMHHAAEHRHFLTQQEINQQLMTAGFKHIQHLDEFDYCIKSSVVAKYYFKTQQDAKIYQDMADRCELLKKRHRILIESSENTFYIPGRITVAKRPTHIEENLDTFRSYPMDFLRELNVHRQLRDTVSKYIQRGSSVLDVGCGIGLMAEDLAHHDISFEGLDIHPDMISACRERFADVPYFRFYEQDINECDFTQKEVDHVCLLNTLHLQSIDPIALIKKSLAALKKGGTIFISGPNSKDSFTLVEPFILEQMRQDGIPDDHPDFIALRKSNEQILKDHGHYWSAEGMSQLLLQLGFEEIAVVNTELYHGFSYLVVGRK